MKHELNPNVNFNESIEVSKDIINIVSSNIQHSIPTDVEDIYPLVSNYTHTRVQKELENERFVTLIKLARVFDDETLSKTINVLGYTLNVK